MRLFSQSSQFVFNLPSDLVPEELVDKYTKLLEKSHSPYETPIDYLNHAIKTINFPGLTMNLVNQTLRHGKKVDYRPATNVNDIVTSRELQITFGSKDSDLNYWMLSDIILKYYLKPDIYSKPLMIKCLDVYRDVIYTITFNEVILSGISDNLFSYSNQKVSNKEFTVTANFNFIDVIFEVDGSKTMQLDRIIEE